MMKNYIVLGFVCLFSSALFGQQIRIDFNEDNKVDERISPLVKEKVNQYALEVRQVVIEEKLAMEKEVSQVNEDLSANLLNEEEANNLKADIALRFSERINQKIESLNFNLDEVTKQQVQYSIMNTDMDQLKKDQENGTKLYRTKNQVTGYFGFGMITLPDGDNEKLNNHLGISTGIDAGFIYDRQFHRTSPFTFKTGIYFSWRTVRFEDDYYLSRDENGTVDLVEYDLGLKKSKLRGTYIMVPIGISYHAAKIEIDEEGNSYRNIHKGFGVSANVYGGFRISNNNIVKGENIDWRHRKSNMNLNDFAYGAQLTLNYKSWNVFVRQEFSSYFKENTFDDRKMLQFGIGLGF